MLSEMSEKDKYCMMSLICGTLPKKKKNLEKTEEWCLPKTYEWGIGETLFKGTYLQLVDK